MKHLAPPARFLVAVLLATGASIGYVAFPMVSIVHGQESELRRSRPDLSRGWIVGNEGFATRSKISAGVRIQIRVETMGDARGIVVTYSGNPAVSEPGKLWPKDSIFRGGTIDYSIPESLDGQILAVRSGAEPAGYDRPLSVEKDRGAYRLSYASGRSLLVSIGRRLPPARRHVRDLSGGWTAFTRGFATNSNIAVRSAVTIRVVNSGNDYGLAVTFSGNPNLDSPGKLWRAAEVKDGITLLYQIPPVLSNQQIAIRSGTFEGGLDRPSRVEKREHVYRLYYTGGRIIDVNISNPN